MDFFYQIHSLICGATERTFASLVSKKIDFFSKTDPNTVTFCNLFIGLSSCLLVANSRNDLLLTVIASLFINLFSILDVLDGALAREYEKTSNRGAFFDDFVNKVISVLLILSIGITFDLTEQLIITTLIIYFFHSYIRIRYEMVVKVTLEPESTFVYLIFSGCLLIQYLLDQSLFSFSIIGISLQIFNLIAFSITFVNVCSIMKN